MTRDRSERALGSGEARQQRSSARRLLLIPTAIELGMLPGAPELELVELGEAQWGSFDVALCGFGPVDAAAGAMFELARRPNCELCVLIGWAGTYSLEFGPGELYEVASMRMDGVGIGREPVALVDELGFPEGCRGHLPLTSRECASAELPIEGFRSVESLTVCAASADLEHAAARAERYAEARIEVMEDFSVARAARLAGVPFACLRAVTNTAGDRDKERWDFELASGVLAEGVDAMNEAFEGAP